MPLSYTSDDLNSGRLLQRSLLPQSLPVYPGLEIAGEVWTAVDLGGDYYQFLEQSGLFGVAIADSSGKSVAGAIHAALFKGQLDAFAQQGRLQNPVSVLRSLNQLLCASHTDDAVALAYGALDLGTYELSVANAGIPGPAIYRAATKTCEEIINPGIALGRFPGTPYAAIVRPIEEGDVVVFYSDGLSEARNSDGEEFSESGPDGQSPLHRALIALAHRSAADIVRGLKAALDEFSGRDIPEDDVSIVVIKLLRKVSLSQLRDCPYQEALRAWLRSDEKDDSALLRGSRLAEALAWAQGQQLGPADRAFLEASQRVSEREQMQAERAAAADRLEKLSQDLSKSLEAEKQHRLQAEIGELNERIIARTMSSEALYLSNNHIEALIASSIAGVQLRRLITQFANHSGLKILKPNTQIRAVTALEQVMYGIHEYNRFEGHGYWVNQVAYSPDGKYIASCSSDRTIKLWTPNGALVQTLFGHGNWVTSLCFSPDGKLLATASRDNTLRLWHFDEAAGKFDEQAIQVFKGHEGPVLDVCFSPDGQLLASASEDMTARLWKLNGAAIKTMRGGHERWVTCVAFHPSGQTLVTGSADRTLILWNLNGTPSRVFKGHDSFVEDVCFEPNAQAIISCSRDRTVRIWNPNDGTLIRTLAGHSGRVWGVSCSPDGKTIASASGDRTVRIWSLDGTLLNVFVGHGDVVLSTAFSPDGKTVASSSRDTTVKLWSLRGTPLRVLLGSTEEIYCVANSPDGSTIAAGCRDGSIALWEANGTLLGIYKDHVDRVNSLCFSPDGQLLISGSADSTIKFWTLEGRALNTRNAHRGEVHCVDFRSDGQVFATSSSDGTVRVWRADGTWLQTLSGHGGEVYAVCFSPDGTMLASASKDKTVNVWGWDGTLLRTLDGHSAEVYALAFSPNNQFLASGSADQSVKLWGIDGSLLKTLNGHSAEVRSVCFSPDGNAIVSGGEDALAQLWSTDGTLLRTFNGHKGGVRGIRFTPNGKTLLTASADKTIVAWNLDLDNLLIRSCSWLQEYLKTNLNVSEEDRRNCLGGCSWLYKYLKNSTDGGAVFSQPVPPPASRPSAKV